MKELILLRGLPGSGKSTFAKTLVSPGSQYFEADQFFVDSQGNYNFDITKLKEAHKWCRNEVEYAMAFGYKEIVPKEPLQRIIVSNTFTQEWEMEPYFKLAGKFGYRVYSLVVENRHRGKSIHNVPKDTLTKMELRMMNNIVLNSN